jgi:hypothetical protein
LSKSINFPNYFKSRHYSWHFIQHYFYILITFILAFYLLLLFVFTSKIPAKHKNLFETKPFLFSKYNKIYLSPKTLFSYYINPFPKSSHLLQLYIHNPNTTTNVYVYIHKLVNKNLWYFFKNLFIAKELLIVLDFQLKSFTKPFSNLLFNLIFLLYFILLFSSHLTFLIYFSKRSAN